MKEVKQEKLKATEIAKTVICADMLPWAFKWDRTPEGYDWWAIVEGKLRDIAKHGTTDGKPYVKSERWRVPTDEDAKRRPKCRVRDSHGEEWKMGMLLYLRQSEVTAYPFYIVDNRNNVVPYRYCEILDNETKTE